MAQSFAQDMSAVPKSRNLAVSLERAFDYAHAAGHRFVRLEHLLLALSEDSEAVAALTDCNIDIDRLRGDVARDIGQFGEELTSGEPAADEELKRILKHAAAAVSQGGQSQVGSAVVLAAMIGDGSTNAADLLKAQGLTFEATIKAVAAAAQRAASPAKAPLAEALPVARPAAQPQEAEPRQASSTSPADAAPVRQTAATSLPQPSAKDLLAAARARVASKHAASSSPNGSVDPPEGAADIPAPWPESEPEPESVQTLAPEPTSRPKPDAVLDEMSAAPSLAGPDRSVNANAGDWEAQTASGRKSPTAEKMPAARPAAPVDRADKWAQAIDPPAPGANLERMREPAPARSGQDAHASGAAVAGPAPAVPEQFETNRPRYDASNQAQPGTQTVPAPQPARPAPQMPRAPQSTAAGDGRVYTGVYPEAASPRAAPRQVPAQPGPGPSGPAPYPPWPEVRDPQQPMHAPVASNNAAYQPHDNIAGAPYPPHDTAANGAPMPSQSRPPGQTTAMARSAGSTAVARRQTGQQVDLGQLVENIPRFMRKAVPETIEVRIARDKVEGLANGMQGGGPTQRHDLFITKAMSVRLRAPDGGFWIQSASPETQWIENTLGLLHDDFASWRWTVTPNATGRGRLQLIVSARTVGMDGLAAETPLPDQLFEIRVRTNYKLAAKRLGGWAVAALIGGAVSAFGGQILGLMPLKPLMAMIGL